MRVSPDGRRGLVTTQVGDVWLWDGERGGPLRALSGHTNRVADAAFSADSRFAVSVAQDNTLRLWDLDTRECLRVVETGEHLFTRVRFSADDRFVLAGTMTGPVLRWEVDWELAAQEAGDDTDAARPLLAALAGTARLTGDVVPERDLLRTVRYAGFGAVRPDAVLAAFRRLTSPEPSPEPGAGEPTALDAMPGLAEHLAYGAATFRASVRKLPEAALVVEQGPCPECAGRRGSRGDRAVPGERRAAPLALEVRCASCGAEFRWAVMVSDADDTSTSPDRWFGGPAPSWFIEPSEWLAFADRCTSPYLAAAAVAEVLKFVPEDGDRVPDHACSCTIDGEEEVRAHPERYGRAALEARLAAHLAALAAEGEADTVP